jgi:hypothetical protein
MCDVAHSRGGPKPPFTSNLHFARLLPFMSTQLYTLYTSLCQNHNRAIT